MVDGVYFAIDGGAVYFSQISLVHAAKIAFISQIAKFWRIFVCNHIKKSPYLCKKFAKMGCTSAIRASSIAFGLHHHCTEFEKWYEKEDFYDDGDSTRHSCIY